MHDNLQSIFSPIPLVGRAPWVVVGWAIVGSPMGTAILGQLFCNMSTDAMVTHAPHLFVCRFAKSDGDTVCIPCGGSPIGSDGEQAHNHVWGSPAAPTPLGIDMGFAEGRGPFCV